MPSVGSSSTSSCGWVTRARAIASCCCWPPERSPPRRPSMDLQHREQLEQLVRDLALVARQPGKAGLEVLAHGQQREDLAALRHIGDAAPRPLVGLHARDVLAVEQDAAAAHRLVADDGAKQRALADAVAAEHAGDLAALGGHRHLPQRLRGAVVQIDVLNGQHCYHLLQGRRSRRFPPPLWGRDREGGSQNIARRDSPHP